MSDRRIIDGKIYEAEDRGLVPLSGDPKKFAKSIRCAYLKPVNPTPEELDAMAAGKRVTAQIRASLGIDAGRPNRAVAERSAGGMSKDASAERSVRGGRLAT